MTRAAFKKIVLCLTAFLLLIGCCLALDIPLGTNAYESVPTREDIAASTDPIDDRASLVSRLLGEEEVSTLGLAREHFGQSIAEQLPPNFSTEILDTHQFSEAYCSQGVISLAYDGTTEEAFACCNKMLEDNGWSAIEGSNTLVSNYIRSSGDPNWLTLQFIAIGNKTVVLVNSIENP